MSLVSLDQVSVAYGHLPLLDRANLQVDPGERLCIIGRNGTGKSTLLQLLSGVRDPDSGIVHRASGLALPQNFNFRDTLSWLEVGFFIFNGTAPAEYDRIIIHK